MKRFGQIIGVDPQQFEKYKKQLKAGEVDELDKAIKKIDPSK